MSDALVCRPAVDAGGLPGRTNLMVARDERRFAMYAAVVAEGRRVRGEPVGIELTHATLIERLNAASGDVDLGEEAAWVAGRCTTGDADADAATRAAVEALIDHSAGGTYIEALLSAALLDEGQIERSRRLLTELALDADRNALVGYVAAARLAQLGSAEGYPVLYRELHDSDSAHSRLMAARELAAFLPYDRQTVDGVTIDVLGELTARLRDEDDLGASEAPDLLLETGLPGAVEAVERAAGRGHAKSVRQAAKLALDWFAHQSATS